MPAWHYARPGQAGVTMVNIGDLVLATGYLRDDRVLDDVLPLSVPVVPNHTLNALLLSELTARGLPSRMGIVFTTVNRNWELQLTTVEERLRASRAVAVDMESATVAANGFRYRIPAASGSCTPAACPPPTSVPLTNRCSATPAPRHQPYRWPSGTLRRSRVLGVIRVADRAGCGAWITASPKTQFACWRLPQPDFADLQTKKIKIWNEP